MIKQIESNFKKVFTRLRLIITKAIVDKINDSTEVQLLDVSSLDSEVLKTLERIQEYGLSTVPPAKASAIIGSQGGDRSNSVVLKTGYPQGRPKDKQEGDVTLWDIHGNTIELTSDGIKVTGAEVNINNGTEGAARENDTVEVTIPALSFIVEVTGGAGAPAVGVKNPNPVVVDGFIDSSSGSVKIGD